MENGDFGDDDFMNEEFGAEEFESVFLALLAISAVLALLTLRLTVKYTTTKAPIQIIQNPMKISTLRWERSMTSPMTRGLFIIPSSVNP